MKLLEYYGYIIILQYCPIMFVNSQSDYSQSGVNLLKYRFSDLVDIPTLQNLMETFYLITEIPSGILDADGNVLVAVGWQEICVKFHRKNSYTESLCRQSDECIKDRLDVSGSYICYKCHNGLMEAAAPIVIDGDHLANVYRGQFFLENPDIEFFRNQAHKYGFDENEYLAALSKVPIYSPEKLDLIMTFFIKLAEMIGSLGIARLRQIEIQAKKIEESENQLFKIFDNTPNIAIQSYDQNGYIRYWNNASQRIYGFASEEVAGKYIDQTILDQKSATTILDMIKKINVTAESCEPVELNLKSKEGTDKIVYSTLFPISLSRGKEYICMSVDITERKRLEREISRLDRLNLIGEMAASIGHEIRNPMTTVKGYLQLLRKKSSFNNFVEQFDIMIEELDHANQIIKEFLSLANNRRMDKKLQNLNEVIKSLIPLIYADAVKDNKIVNVTLGEIPDLLLDENEIRQLILNLTRNGSEAMHPGGVLNIKTFVDSDELVLAVQDNGHGIREELMNKIGTPFFTTKPQAVGLGLSICYSIAAKHQARIVIDSNSLGTTVFVRFLLPQI